MPLTSPRFIVVRVNNDATSTVRCDERMLIPPPRCSLPRGHEGPHVTYEIPEPYTGPVADAIVREEEASGMIETIHRRYQEWSREKRWLLTALYTVSSILVFHVITDLLQALPVQ